MPLSDSELDNMQSRLELEATEVGSENEKDSQDIEKANELSSLNNNNPIPCDVCDSPISYIDICTLHIQGIARKIHCHPKCADLFLRCKGDFTLLPNGKLKRAIAKETSSIETIRNTGITVRNKQAKAIIEGLKKGKEEGYRLIYNLAVTFYGLNKPNIENGEFYSIDSNKQLVLMRRNTYQIIEATRE